MYPYQPPQPQKSNWKVPLIIAAVIILTPIGACVGCTVGCGVLSKLQEKAHHDQAR
jgi:hypothetical protein